MSDEHRFERDARAWLELGPTDAPDRVVEAALLEIDKTSQERVLWIPWRLPTMTPRLGLAATALVAVVGLGLVFLNLPGRGGTGAQSPSPTLPAPTSTPGAPAASPDYMPLEGWIVFEHFYKAPDGSTPADVDYPRSLWLVHADGTGLHELAPGPGSANGKVSPDISPDGTHVVFSAWDPPFRLWEVGIDGGDPLVLNTGCGGYPDICEDRYPAYSPDGGKIAFVVGTDQSSMIEILDLASGNVAVLTSTMTASKDDRLAEPSWSPDGTQLVYHQDHFDVAQDKFTDASIFIANVDDTGARELALPEGAPYGDADWSPDGSWIVFSSYPIREFNSEKASVYRVRPDGTDLEQLTASGVGNGAPSWTSDGAHIFYWGFRTFYLMDPDGGNAQAINETGLAFYGDVLGYGYYGLLQPTP